MGNSNNIYHFFGFNNSIVSELLKRNSFKNYKVYEQENLKHMVISGLINTIELDNSKNNIILYTWGKLYPSKLINQSFEEKVNGYLFNFLIPVSLIEEFNSTNCKFNFIYMSSESAKKGSFDGNYASQKAATELYIRECQLSNKESIVVGVAPSMIIDAGMTKRRSDKNNVLIAEQSHPKGRLLYTPELVNVIEFLLFQNTYITNTIIEMNGGKFARMKN
jgi:hypothetical protein